MPDESWVHDLKQQDASSMAQELADLARHAQHEYKYARKDGEKELNDRKKEFERKRKHILHRFHRMADPSYSPDDAAPALDLAEVPALNLAADSSDDRSWMGSLTDGQRAEMAKEL